MSQYEELTTTMTDQQYLVEALRRQASGRFLSAARPGVFSTESDSPATSGRRAFRETE